MRENELYKALPTLLVPWYNANKRDLPWRKNRDPYRVWLSEIMLQQTRVEAVRERYLLFLSTLPTVTDLANAPEEELLKLWEGLGYYSRARNLHKAAKAIAASGGSFPTEVAALRKLPGVGEYTAGAIASICYDTPIAAVDGNVLRVLSRVLASDKPIDDAAVKAEMHKKLTAVYPKGSCGEFTQSFMDLGSGICTPRSPHCNECPLRDVCRAHARGIAEGLPVKAPKKAKREEALTVFLLECDGAYAIEKRSQKGVLHGLWQLPNVQGTLTPAEGLQAAEAMGVGVVTPVRELHREHIFTHIRWEMTCYHLRCLSPCGSFVWATEQELANTYALPTAFRKFLDIGL